MPAAWYSTHTTSSTVARSGPSPASCTSALANSSDQLTAAGFAQVEIAGDWEHGPLTAASPIMVVRAVRS